MTNPSDIAGLLRYGVAWDGPDKPTCQLMDDGYWTPWHVAKDLIEKLVAERDEAREKNAAYFDEVTACYATIADERQALEAAQAKVGRYEAALDYADAMALNPNGSGGMKITLNYADVSQAGRAFANLSEYFTARKALAEGGSNG